MQQARSASTEKATAGVAYLDDFQAILTGSLLAAMAVGIFQQARLVPGGTVGLSLLLQSATQWDVGLTLLLANAPFYLLAMTRLGGAFMVRTLATLLLTACFTSLLPRTLSIEIASPMAAAVVGGVLCGLAMLVVFRHGSSLGGLNIVVLWLQRRYGWKPAHVQLALDAAIVTAGAAAAGTVDRLGASLAAVLTLNLVLMFNHRPQVPLQQRAPGST